MADRPQTDGNSMHRVSLVMTGQSKGQSKSRHPLTGAYSNVGDHAGVAEAVNAWLDSYRART